MKNGDGPPPGRPRLLGAYRWLRAGPLSRRLPVRRPLGHQRRRHGSL